MENLRAMHQIITTAPDSKKREIANGCFDIMAREKMPAILEMYDLIKQIAEDPALDHKTIVECAQFIIQEQRT